MDLNINQGIKQFLSLFILVLLPLIIILVGLIAQFYNALYYILSIIWFGTGLIFFDALIIND